MILTMIGDTFCGSVLSRESKLSRQEFSRLSRGSHKTRKHECEERSEIFCFLAATFQHILAEIFG